MRILMQAGLQAGDLRFDRWQHAIIGDAIDPRGDAAIAFAKSHATMTHLFRYDAKKLLIDFDGQSFSIEESERILTCIEDQSVLLEATTLGFVEILLCCRALKERKQKSLTLLYTEPQNYYRPRRSQIVHRRDFELSEEVQKFAGLPGNMLILSEERPLKVVVFVGFEGQRLNRFLEQTGLSASKCEFVFGVPAFQPGWEMDAFENNFRVLKGDQMAGRIHFCGAQNPVSAYNALSQIYTSCTAERMSITPIGTKPHGIGSALFLSEHADVGVVYDNPKRKRERTDKVGMWHLFDAEF